MKKPIGALATAAILAGVLVASGASAAQAGYGHSVGGGIWNHFVDINGKTNASSYYHPTAFHRASVENPGYGLVRDYAGPKIWAAATQHSYAYGNKAYWYRY